MRCTGRPRIVPLSTSERRRRAVFVDRDGVLNDVVMRNDAPASPRTLEELVMRPGARSLVANLQRAGFLVFVVTNQPDVARGLMPRSAHDAIMAALQAALAFDDARACLHDDSDACSCRKPAPGMLLDLAAEWDVDLSRSFLLGDSMKDMKAGHAAGCTTVLLRTTYNAEAHGDAEVDTLAGAADWITAAADGVRLAVAVE
jgi:D-glycero-D-manno-heptose 1,7-bisphosphate phosphatase